MQYDSPKSIVKVKWSEVKWSEWVMRFGSFDFDETLYEALGQEPVPPQTNCQIVQLIIFLKIDYKIDQKADLQSIF